MKTVLLLFSFLLFAFSANPLLGAAENVLDPVLDTAGDKLQTGVGYYVMSVFWGAGGGGLTLVKNYNGSICPLDVGQLSSDLDNGLPLTFLPLDNDDVVRVGTDLQKIEFSSTTTICAQSTVWEIADYPGSERPIVTTDGVGGTIVRRFRIARHTGFPTLPVYKFVYCVARMVCQDIGIFAENGVRRLAVSQVPHAVVFIKAEVSLIRKVTSRFTS